MTLLYQEIKAKSIGGASELKQGSVISVCIFGLPFREEWRAFSSGRRQVFFRNKGSKNENKLVSSIK